MPNKSYNRASAFDRRIKTELEDDGYHVIKSGRSKGPVDLSATSAFGTQLWIQCKKDGKLSKVEFDKLVDHGYKFNTTTLHVCKPKRNEKVKFEVIHQALGRLGHHTDPDWEELC